MHVGPNGPVEVARHLRATPGSPKTIDAHFPPAPAGALDRQASESRSLTQGTSAWSALPGTAGTDGQVVDRDDPGGLDGTGGHADVVVLP